VEIAQAIGRLGSQQATVARVQGQLRQGREAEAVPSTFTMRQVMRKELGLRYRASLGAKVMYNDPAYDEKRLWISRLLA